METDIKTLDISSEAFENEGGLPSKYTCDGEEINPPLKIENLPEEAQSLVIIVEDPDATNGTFDHWLVWNIDRVATISENSNPGINGKNSAGKTGYHGPCPPSGTHRYYFNVFALDHHIDLISGADKKELQIAMKPHIVAKGSIMARYKKTS